MAQHTEAWQVYAPNGEQKKGESILPIESRKTSEVIVGAVHIWIWRRTDSGLEVLLQKRATDKPTWPDFLDISAAGHIDQGETLAEAAYREAEEEIGLSIDVDKLEFVFSYRNFENGIKWVYLYEQSEAYDFTFNDGEVQSLRWVPVYEFGEMITSPNEHNLVPHPEEYFSLLSKAIQHFE